MKLAVRVKLLPTAEQAEALAATLHTCNAAASVVSRAAFVAGVYSRNDLQKLTYHDIKADHGLSAQPAVRVVKKVVDAYTTLHATVRAGNLGGPASKRRLKAESKPIMFRSDAAQPFDDRCLSWQHDVRTVSLWTMRGRMKAVAFTGHPDQLKTLVAHRRGESDLVRENDNWYLVATCEIPEKPLNVEPVDWIGLDRGIVNLATTSDGDNFQGRGLSRYRRWHAHKRQELQAKRTKAAKRRLKRRARKEARHAAHINHVVSKEVVAVAERTGRGIALEELRGIRDRVRLHRHQRATLTTWPFHQLGTFIAYKARRAGVPVLEVDAHYTSQRCPRCGETSRRNRPSRDDFCCRRCGLAGPADVVAAVNVRNRARRAWVFVNTPKPQVVQPGVVDAARTPQPVAARGTQARPFKAGSLTIGSDTRCRAR
ncbi:transposase [Lentzea sp. NPDC005914]|uniref:RNA-guided endonuclease InsQ/TnpB family protein n=1 Tax=Lentzea sp. NPDC005914 TaxID=3154572 RepID=UPI0033E86E6B